VLLRAGRLASDLPSAQPAVPIATAKGSAGIEGADAGALLGLAIK